MPDAVHSLAIVIPAYKARFLQEALASIAAQTDQRFHLYVCDDGSPDDLKTICERAGFPGDRLTFRRFEQNMGARHLARHWNRSVECTGEPWVWLFSDDDVMENKCVETFLQAAESGGDGAAQVYRFNTLVIDADGNVLRINPPHPRRESAIEFAYHRMTFQRESYAPEYIFRRSAWESRGGFVEFPFAQGSDDASWITLTHDEEIRLLTGPRVRWRLSGTNISGSAGPALIERLRGCLEFAAWLQRRFAGESPLPASTPLAFDMDGIARDWMLTMLRNCPAAFSTRDLRELPALVQAKLGVPRRRALQAMLLAKGRGAVRGFVAPIRRALFGARGS